MDGQGFGVTQIEQPLDEVERIEKGQPRVVAPSAPKVTMDGTRPCR